MEEVDNLWERLETDDVGQRRYLMYRIFDLLLDRLYNLKETDAPGVEERVRKLQETEGYIYKLSQDFLTSSSTMEKRDKLEKIKRYVESRTED